MGMYDSVIAKCPLCKKGRVEFQTKSGPCCLEIYNFEEADNWILESINGDTARCDNCDKEVRAEIDIEIILKNKQVIPANNLDYIKWRHDQKKSNKPIS